MSEAVLRCKVRVNSVAHYKKDDGTTESEVVTLQAVHSNDPSSENARWSKYTPGAQFSITISNPDAMNQLSKGHEFYVDFIPA